MHVEKAVEELRAELAPELLRSQQWRSLWRSQERGAGAELAKLVASPYAEGLPTDKVIQRLDLVRWFKNGQRIFYKKPEDHRWDSGTFLDFHVPGLKARVLIRDQEAQTDKILVLDPDQVQLVSRAEKTQLQLEKQGRFIEKQLEECRQLLGRLRDENARVKAELTRERKRCSLLLAPTERAKKGTK